MSTLRAALFAAFLIAGAACSVRNHVPAEVYTVLKDPDSFQIYSAVSAIPVSVRTSFAQAAHKQSFEMAEPGAKWQEYDVVNEPGLLPRRLRTVAVSKKFCLLFYQLGGFAQSNLVAVFRLSQGRAELVWITYLNSPISDPRELSAAIKRGKVDGTSARYF